MAEQFFELLNLQCIKNKIGLGIYPKKFKNQIDVFFLQ